MKLPKHADIWLPAYLHNRARYYTRKQEAKRLWVAITDHYEPLGGGVNAVQALARVAAWQERWPRIAADAPEDDAGNAPRFTFFYPQEEYRSDLLMEIASICRNGTADVEVHLHHENDTAASFRSKLEDFCARLMGEHGLLRMQDGRPAFGFIHGNWALDNAYPDGRLCGVTGELQILRDLGCFADFTMPSLPVGTQGRILNQVYWTNGDPHKPKGYDQGTEATPNGGRRGDLLMITGPTGIRYRDRLLPRLETGELASYDLPTPYRVERWIDLAPRIGGDIFLKLYGHSAREDNATALLGTGTHNPGALGSMFRWLAEAAQQRNLELHWASAYEMFQAVESITQPSPMPELMQASCQ